MSDAYTLEGYDKTFRTCIMDGYHECAKLIYPFISPSIANKIMLSDIIKTLHNKINYIPSKIAEVLTAYTSTLSFLLDINYQNSDGYSALVELLRKLTKPDYEIYGKSLPYQELVTNLIKLDCDIADPHLVEACVTHGALGGLTILENYGSINASVLSMYVSSLGVKTDFQDLISFALKYIKINDDCATIIVEKYISYHSYKFIINSKLKHKFFDDLDTLIKNNQWRITLDDRIVNILTGCPHIIPDVLNITSGVNIVNIHEIRDVDTFERLKHLPNIVHDSSIVPDLEDSDGQEPNGW